MKNQLFLKICQTSSIWNAFWEANILDFCILFDVFEKQISNNVLEGKKLKKMGQETQNDAILGRPCGMRGLLGREKERGQKPLEPEVLGRSS